MRRWRLLSVLGLLMLLALAGYGISQRRNAADLAVTTSASAPAAAARSPNSAGSPAAGWSAQPPATAAAAVSRAAWSSKPVVSETAHLIREVWLLEIAGLTVYPLRERIVTRTRSSGAVVSTAGESERAVAPRTPTGSFHLSERQVRDVARISWESWGPPRGPARAQEIEKIVWAEDRTEGAPSQLAYRVLEQGRETVIDAQSGEVLMRADRRIRN